MARAYPGETEKIAILGGDFLSAIFWGMVVLLILRVGVDVVVVGTRIYQHAARKSGYTLLSTTTEIEENRFVLTRAQGQVDAVETYFSKDHAVQDSVQISPTTIENMCRDVGQEVSGVQRALGRISRHGRDFAQNRALLQRHILGKFCVDILVISVSLVLIS